MKKLWDLLFLFSSIFMLFMFIALFLGSLRYWATNYPYGAPIDSILFYISVFAAIVTTLAQWIEGRVRKISELIIELKGGKKWQKQKKKQKGIK